MNFMRWKVGVSALGLILLTASTAARAGPNIVVIMTDDQDSTSLAHMPKTLQRLAAQGTSFTNHLVSNPMCGPSRATLFTGQYSHNHKVLNNFEPYGGYSKFNQNNTLPMWLQASGYHTTLIGKYINGAGTTPTPPPGWSDFQFFGATYYNYGVTRNGITTKYGDSPEDYQTDVIKSNAVAAIRERAAAGGPFFMAITPFGPHVDQSTKFPIPAPRHLGLFSGQSAPRAPSYNEADVSDKPLAIRTLPLIEAGGEVEIATRYRATLETLQAVDELVEAVVDTLEAENVMRDTVVMFASDNGHFYGEHRIPTSKQKLYVESVRVPLIVRGRPFAAGVTTNVPVTNVDMATTIVALAGATPGLPLDGASLVSLVSDPQLANRAVLLENFDVRSGLPTVAVQTARYFYAVWDTSAEDELYDLQLDPGQTASLHADTAYASIKSLLSKKLDRLRNCSGMTCAVRF